MCVCRFVSHCPTNSAREEFVTKLRQYVQVDVFGKCGVEPPCPRETRYTGGILSVKRSAIVP